MSEQIDKVIERLATEIATAVQVKRHETATMLDEPLMFSTLQIVITDELEPVSRVVEAAQWLLDNIGVYGTNEICMCEHDTEGCCTLVDEYCVKCRLEPALANLQEQKSE